MRAQFAGLTHAGGRRVVNEDSILVAPPIFAVADGMGGHKFGDSASAAVTAALADVANGSQRNTVELDADVIRAALWSAQEEIRELVQHDGGGRAGSTVAGLALLEADSDQPRVLAFNVGDSRIYRHSCGGFEQVSEDHSLVAELVRLGELDPAEAASHPQRNIITRAVGSGIDVEPDFWVLNARPGDRFLICTDGLVNEITDAELADALASPERPRLVAEALIDRAVADGARDNVSVVIVAFEGAGIDERTSPRIGWDSASEDTRPRGTVASSIAPAGW